MYVKNVMLVGSGAREVAFAANIALHHPEVNIFVAPGNAETSQRWTNIPCPVPGTFESQDVYNSYFRILFSWCVGQEIDLLVVLPEDAIDHGIKEFMEERGFAVFCPSQEAAQIESDKWWAKILLQEAGVPTSSGVLLQTEQEVWDWLTSVLYHRDYPKVVKDPYLCSGKGVTIAHNFDEAIAAAKEILARGRPVLIEKFLKGREASAFAFLSWKRGEDGEIEVIIKPWGIAVDYKVLYPGGPNTGGVGAYSPVPWIGPEIEKEIWAIFDKLAWKMAEKGCPFSGTLYVGLMIDGESVYVLECNCRPGDPETQVLAPRTEADLLEVMVACVEGTLEQVVLAMTAAFMVAVVCCSAGYPGDYEKGKEIAILGELPEGVVVFESGTKKGDRGQVLTNGGRVLTVVGKGETIEKARESAYAGVTLVAFEGAYHRDDIAQLN